MRVNEAVANVGAAVIAQSPGSLIHPWFLGSPDENDVQGYAGTPVNVKPISLELPFDIGAAGAIFPRQGRYYVSVDSGRDPFTGRSAAGQYVLCVLANDVLPPLVSLLTREVSAGRPTIALRVLDAARASPTRGGRRSAVARDRLRQRPDRRLGIRPGLGDRDLRPAAAGADRCAPADRRSRPRPRDFQESKNVSTHGRGRDAEHDDRRAAGCGSSNGRRRPGSSRAGRCVETIRAAPRSPSSRARRRRSARSGSSTARGRSPPSAAAPPGSTRRTWRAGSAAKGRHVLRVVVRDAAGRDGRARAAPSASAGSGRTRARVRPRRRRRTRSRPATASRSRSTASCARARERLDGVASSRRARPPARSWRGAHRRLRRPRRRRRADAARVARARAAVVAAARRARAPLDRRDRPGGASGARGRRRDQPRRRHAPRLRRLRPRLLRLQRRRDRAAGAARARPSGLRALVVDLDVHQGDGTHSLLADDAARVHRLGERRRQLPLPARARRPRGRPPGRHGRRALPRGARAAAAAGARRGAAGARASCSPAPIRTRATGSGASRSRRRAWRSATGLVRDTLRAAGVPVCVTLAGGYAEPIEDTVEINLETVRTFSG